MVFCFQFYFHLRVYLDFERLWYKPKDKEKLMKKNVSCCSNVFNKGIFFLLQELQPGQGVIVPSFTFAASAEVMPVMGAIPIFAEVDKTSFNLDPEKLPQALAAGKAAGIDIVGIIGVGLFGQPADYAAIGNFARENGLWLIDEVQMVVIMASPGGREVNRVMPTQATPTNARPTQTELPSSAKRTNKKMMVA